MAARRGGKATVSTSMKNNKVQKIESASQGNSSKDDFSHFYPPLLLVIVVLICSGTLALLSIRDFALTGRNLLGVVDERFLSFTKSKDWFDDSKGWKSTQGGFSAVQQISTDENNMGGFFVRKLAGAASLGVQLQKLVPFVFHPSAADWSKGHFKPLLGIAILANIAIILFYSVYLPDLLSAGAEMVAYGSIGLLSFESLFFSIYLLQRSQGKTIAIAMPEGKTPSSIPSRIVARTVLIISSFVSLVAARDLFFPGRVIEMIPRDDIYLEWTNAFLHSPPEGSPEAAEYGMESPLFVGDKFVSQWMALNLLLLCMYKLSTALFIRFGNDGSGMVKCKMIWVTQALANGTIVFIFRIFTPAAGTASLHFQWHLMALSYETFILFLYAYF